MELPFMDLATLAMAFPPCPSGKRPSLELCNHEMLMAFCPSLSRKKQNHGVGQTRAAHCLRALAAPETHFPSCLSRKVSCCALAMDFSPCLPRKRTPDGRGAHNNGARRSRAEPSILAQPLTWQKKSATSDSRGQEHVVHGKRRSPAKPGGVC